MLGEVSCENTKGTEHFTTQDHFTTNSEIIHLGWAVAEYGLLEMFPASKSGR
jgi:hypothetical protein